jgi:hypothetical protein
MSQGGAIFSDMNDFVTFDSSEFKGNLQFYQNPYM